MIKKTYQEYIYEIEDLKEKYKLDSYQVLTLHLAASFKVYALDYDKLKEEFINEKKNKN